MNSSRIATPGPEAGRVFHAHNRGRHDGEYKQPNSNLTGHRHELEENLGPPPPGIGPTSRTDRNQNWSPQYFEPKRGRVSFMPKSGRGRGGGPATSRGSIPTTSITFRTVNPKSMTLYDPTEPNEGWTTFKPDQDNVFPLRPQNAHITNSIKKIRISVNHFEVTLVPPPQIYKYKVDVMRKPRGKPEVSTVTSPGEGPWTGRPVTAPELEQPELSAPPSSVIVRTLPRVLKQKVIHKFLLEERERGFGPEFGLISDFSEYIFCTKMLPTKGDHPYIIQEVRGVDGEVDFVFILRIRATPEIIAKDVKCQVNDVEGTDSTVKLREIDRVYNALMLCVNLGVYSPTKKNILVDFKSERHLLGGGIASFKGFNVLFPMEDGCRKFINIGMAHMTTILDGQVNTVLENIARSRGYKINVEDVRTWARTDFADVASEIFKWSLVYYRPTPDKWMNQKVERVCETSVSETYFEIGGMKTSVVHYYLGQYGLMLNPHGACLECRGKSKPLIPAEICVVNNGQVVSRQLDEEQMKKMVMWAKQNPDILKKSLCNAVSQLNLMTNEKMETYGVTLPNGNKMHEMKANVLTPPELCFGKRVNGMNPNERATIIPQDGVWDDSNVTEDFEFYRNAQPRDWMVLNLTTNVKRDAAWKFIDELVGGAKKKGITLCLPLYENLSSTNLVLHKEAHESNVTALADLFGSVNRRLNSYQFFVIVLIPGKNSPLYSQVKQAAEMGTCLLTQCVVASTVLSNAKTLKSVVSNIIRKLNSKLGEVNHVVNSPPEFPDCFKLFDHPVLIVGATVNHGPPGSTKIKKDAQGKIVECGPPDFVAVTSNTCQTGALYTTHVEGQKRRKKGVAEIITNLERIIRKFLVLYIERTGWIPAKIIYYRDGVGDAHSQEVLRVEMTAIHRACSSMDLNYKPKITFISVQRRHGTRLFNEVGENQVENVPPGTVVDEDIVKPRDIDFYLVSHKGSLGTSRPTRNHVLWDDSRFSPEEIETMTYFLCYMYTRCSRSVKIPAPIYYAYWAAKRAETLTKGLGVDQLADLDWLNNYLEQREQNNFSKNYPMHYI